MAQDCRCYGEPGGITMGGVCKGSRRASLNQFNCGRGSEVGKPPVGVHEFNG